MTRLDAERLGYARDRLIRRFRAKFDETASGCWDWRRPQQNGYGHFWTGSRTVKAHRFSYETFVGPIAGGLVIDHLCHNRRCVNPDHLEPVTQSENLLRGKTVNATSAARTHCVSGHEFTASNTHLTKDGRRSCRECGRARSLAHWRRKYGK